MKPLENITCQFTDPQHWDNHDKVHIDKLKLLIAGEQVRADDVLKAGLWIVTEALRRRETPSFRRGFLVGRLRRVRDLAAKYSMLQQCWPGAEPPRKGEVDADVKALDLLSTLALHAPRNEPGDWQ